ncbi:MAG: hypothetical protein MUO38_09720 [Anaerolineales bacterium]|nr:hypothetical protein [Anaerolineales bacterium]
MRRSSALLFLISVSVLFVAGLVVFHRIPEGFPGTVCAENYRFYGSFSIVLNCDSWDFMRLALHPDRIFEPNTVRQSRPGLIFLAAVLAKPLHFLGDLAQDLVSGQGRTLQDWTITLIPAYASYILLNLTILSVSMALFIHLLPREATPPVPAILLGVILVSNDLVKMFLLTPHTALLALLVPLYCLWSYGIAAGDSRFRWPKILALAVVAGLGITAYATFAAFLPSVLIPELVRLRRAFSWRGLVVSLGRAIVISAVVAFPMVLWIAIVESRAGSFYSAEVTLYEQVVWIGNALRQGAITLVGTLLSHVLAIARNDLRYAVFIIVYLATVAVTAEPGRNGLALMVRSIPRSALVVSALFVAFFALVGVTVDRVAFSAVPPLVVGAAWVVGSTSSGLSRTSRVRMGLVAGLLTTLFVAYELLKTGPFS